MLLSSLRWKVFTSESVGTRNCAKCQACDNDLLRKDSLSQTYYKYKETVLLSASESNTSTTYQIQRMANDLVVILDANIDQIKT